MSQLKVVADFPYDRKNSYSTRNPFEIRFIYPKNGNPFCIKGGRRNLDNWLELNWSKQSYVSHRHLYCHGKQRLLINTVLFSDVFCASIQEDYVMLEIKRIGWDGKPMKVAKVRGRNLIVFKKPTFYERKEVVLCKHISTLPRCFPKEFFPFCND